MDLVDCTILLFGPDAALNEIKPKPLPPRHHAFKGQVTRAILAMLRASKEPLEGHTITLRRMAERDLNSADKRLTKTVQKRVGAVLRNMRERGLAASAAEPLACYVGVLDDRRIILMVDHAPLTPAQRELCNKIGTAPMRMTSGEMVQQGGVGHDANFLMNAGYVNGEIVYVAQNSADSIIQLTRSTKPLV